LNKPLVIQGLTKSFNNKPAVVDLSLEVESGEIFVLLGPNGAGKTTTIKLINGLLAPDKGRILIGGIDLLEKPELAKARIGLVPDIPFLYENLTGREFLYLIGRLRRLEEGAIEQGIETLNPYLDFGDWFDYRCGGYSHGMRQRIMFAQALLHKPELLLIDEPMVGLDPRAMLKIKKLLRVLKRDGVGIFISTHLIPLAEELADRLAVIDHGRLKYCGNRPDFSGRIETIFLNATGD